MGMIREGWNTSGVAYADAIDALHRADAALRGRGRGTTCCWCRRCWLPAAVRCAGPAPRQHRAFFDVEFAHTGWTPMANVTGWAAISLPLGSTADGLPIGVQLMAPRRRSCCNSPRRSSRRLPWRGGAPPDGSVAKRLTAAPLRARLYRWLSPSPAPSWRGQHRRRRGPATRFRRVRRPCRVRGRVLLHGTPGARRQIPVEAGCSPSSRASGSSASTGRASVPPPPHQYENVLAFATDMQTMADVLGVGKMASSGCPAAVYALACAAAMPDRVIAAGCSAGRADRRTRRDRRWAGRARRDGRAVHPDRRAPRNWLRSP